jgi:PAS domain S-box-containing protein
MSTRAFRRLRGFVWVWLLLSVFVMSGAAQEKRPRVLILYTYYSNTAPYQAIASAFKAALIRELGKPVDFAEEPLDIDRFSAPQLQVAYAELLQKRFEGYRFDLIVPVGGPAAQFVAQIKEKVFPGIPTIFLSADERVAPYEFLHTNAIVVTQRINLGSWIEDILQIAPDTTNIMFVAGDSLLERFWSSTERRELKNFSSRVNIIWLDNLSIDQMEKRVSALPPHSFVIVGLMIKDAAGITYSGYEGLDRLHAVANAPIFGIFQSQMGRGIIGGKLYQDESLGVHAAGSAVRILRGEPMANIPAEILPPPPAVFDWRELKRWGISESRLPPGSSILFREPTVWQRYRWYIVGIVLFGLVESLLILGLVKSLLRRRRVEQSLRQSEQKYRRLYESMTDAFVSTDMSGCIREFNPSYQKMLGYSEEELRRLTYLEITPEKWHESEAQIVHEQIMPRGFSDVYEKEYRRKDGTVFPAELRTFLIKDEAANPYGMWAIVRDISERKQAEAAMRQRNRYIETILEKSPIGFAIHTIDDGVGRFISARYEEIYGVPRGTIDSHYTFFDKVWPHDPDLREEIRRRVVADMESEDPSRMCWENVPVPTAIGETRYITAINIPLLDQNLMVSTVQDVTEQVRAQRALRESEERLRLAAEAANFGAFSYNTSSRSLFCTPEVLALYGLPPGASLELDDNDVPKVIHPEDREKFRTQLMIAANPGGSGILDVEYRIIRTDEQVRWLRSIVKISFSPDHRPFRADGITQDISERKRADEALRASEERFRQVAELVSDFVWEVDTDGLYTYTSPSVGRILDYTPDELVGKMHFYDLFAPDVREQLKEAAFKTFARQQRFQAFRNINISKTGKIVYLETSGMPILDETGLLLGYLGTDSDVTEKRQIEMEAQLLRQELALFSRVATLNELAASLAHELNQPLAAILSNAQAALHFMAGGTPDLKELQEIFNDIVAEDQRAAEVIRSLRSMLKKGASEHQPLMLNDLTANVVSIVRNEAMMRRVAVALDLDSTLPSIRGERVQLQQVILNLIVNAFESMESSDQPATLRIRTRAADGEVILDVVDSGSGITADKLTSIFEPFVTTKNDGLGMGLALSQSIVTAHHGRLWAENNPEGGATFHMALPAIKP